MLTLSLYLTGGTDVPVRDAVNELVRDAVAVDVRDGVLDAVADEEPVELEDRVAVADDESVRV